MSHRLGGTDENEGVKPKKKKTKSSCKTYQIESTVNAICFEKWLNMVKHWRKIIVFFITLADSRLPKNPTNLKRCAHVARVHNHPRVYSNETAFSYRPLESERRRPYWTSRCARMRRPPPLAGVAALSYDEVAWHYGKRNCNFSTWPFSEPKSRRCTFVKCIFRSITTSFVFHRCFKTLAVRHVDQNNE